MLLALYTFGQFRLPSAAPENDGFHARNDRNFAAAEASAGFVARSGYADEPGPESWGRQVYPRFHVERGDGWAPSTLSLWSGIDAAMAFSYGGIHAEALRHGQEWFVEPRWPPYAAWWTEARPDWAEAIIRHEHLADHGSTIFAFDFKMPFDASGQVTKVDTAAIRELVRENADRHAAAGFGRIAS